MVEPPSHFFKVILPSSLEDKKLRIPEKFVRKFGDELAAVATLTVPVHSGRVWKVGLMKDGKKIWFHDSWHDFAVYYSISAGYFLVFEYRRNSNFHVLIFDMSACEVQYAYNGGLAINDNRNSTHQDEMETEDSPTPNLSLNSLRNKVLRECPSKGLSSKLYTFSVENQAKPSLGSALRTNKSFNSSKHKQGHNLRIRKCKMEEMVVMYESRQCKLNKTRMSNSQESLHRKRHRNENADNFVPSALVQDMDKIDRIKCKATTHKVEDGNRTEVVSNESKLKNAAYEVGTHSSEGVNKRTKFYENNLLAILDEMGISIARKYGCLTAEESERVINIAKFLKPKNPSFMMILRSSNIMTCRIYVPLNFANTYLKDVKCIKLQYSNDNEWPVEIIWSRSRCFISKGWARFSNEKKLEKGDTCIFELLRMKDVRLKVSVFHMFIG